MGEGERIKTRIKYCFRRVCCLRPKAPQKKDDDNDLEEGKRKKQYRLEATRLKAKKGWLSWCTSGSSLSSASGLGVSPNQALAMYLHWMFRVNFFFLFALSCVVFFTLVIIFSGFIILAGKMDSECVRVGGLEFGNTSAHFADAFALSWTTFSTVVCQSDGTCSHAKQSWNIFSLQWSCSVYRDMEALIQLWHMKITVPPIVSSSLSFARWKPLSVSSIQVSVELFSLERYFVFSPMLRFCSVIQL
jgi:hypothetical protein